MESKSSSRVVPVILVLLTVVNVALWWPVADRLSFPVYYAQAAEDVLIRQALHAVGRTDPNYLDVGAWRPKHGSNTYLLYLDGASGVLVEPNPFFVDMLESERPRDTVLGVGVGITADREADYYLADGGMSQMNTFSPERAKQLQDMGLEMTPTKMELVPLNEIIEAHFTAKGKSLDLLSIDVEGLDYDILKTLDFDRYRPAVICAETLIMGSGRQRDDLIAFVESKGYVLRGASWVNSVFVDEALIE